MTTEKILKLYTSHTERWLKELEFFTPETFSKTTGAEWSAAQVVDHICKTTHQCLAYAAQCCENKGERHHSGFGPAIFGLMGAFPPVRINVKIPPKGVETLYTPQNISLDEAYENLLHALENMRMMLPKLKKADPGVRVKHWAGGWFNATQWYHNAEMHIKHHFRQLKRIRKQI